MRRELRGGLFRPLMFFRGEGRDAALKMFPLSLYNILRRLVMNRFFRHAVSGVAIALMAAGAAQAAATLPNFVPLAKNAGPAVVNISTEREVVDRMSSMFEGLPPGMERFFEQFGPFQGRQGPRTRNALGSGFIISSDGYIVTNNHVVEGADKIYVNLEGDSSKAHSLEARLIGRDPETDIALLKVDSDKSLPVLPFGDSDRLEVGEWVVAIGNPFGLSTTVTAGILSAKGRDIHSGPFDNFLQTDASINPGNSGGPLINMDGEVIGINTAIVASGQGIGFAIPSNLAMKIVDELKEGKKVSRGWLGVAIQDVDENVAKALGLKDAQGALIGSVTKGEPADKGGLKAGDVIIRVGKNSVKDSAELLRRVAELKPGTEVSVTVMRNGKELRKTVVLGERAQRGIQQEESRAESGIALGLNVRPLTRENARALDLPADTKGLLVVKVNPGSPADKAGLQSGDVIRSANLTEVTDADELRNILEKEAKERGAVMFQILRRGDSFFVTIPFDSGK